MPDTPPPFVPPEPLPLVPPTPAASAQAPQHPPSPSPSPFAHAPTSQANQYTSAAAPPATRWPWLALSIIAGCLVLLAVLAALLVSAIANAVQSLNQAIEEQYTPPEVEYSNPWLSPMQGATTQAPPVCDACFNQDIMKHLVPERSALVSLGLTRSIDRWGWVPVSSPRLEHERAVARWSQTQSAPERCFVTAFTMPVAAALESPPESTAGVIHPVGKHEDVDKRSQLEQSVRIFETPELAQEHLDSLRGSVDGCTHYESNAAERGTVDVAPAPALDLPPDVTMTGWVGQSDEGTYWSFDLRRNNLVVRVALRSTPGGISDGDFRGYVEDAARQLAAVGVENG